MSNLNNTIRGESPKEEYNNIPVVYCKNCLSLKIRVLDEDVDYCDDCGSTELASTDIETWKEMWEKRYNKPF